MTSSTERFLTIAILGLALLVRIAFAFATPAWQSPDEYPHYWVAQEIAWTGKLPVSAPLFPRYESFQPPLYYAVGSLLLLDAQPLLFTEAAVPPPGPLLLLRLLSVAAGVLTIAVTAQILKRIPSLKSADRPAALALLALLPTYVGTTSTANNDAFVVLFSAVALLYAMEPYWEDMTAFRVGLWAGLALLTKHSAVILIPFLLMRAFAVSVGDWKSRVRVGGVMLAGWLPSLVLLIVRDIAQYGAPFSINPGLPRGFSLGVGELLHALRNLGWSFWLAFGRTYQVTLPGWIYVVTVVPLMLLMLWGWKSAWKSNRSFLAAVAVSVCIGLLVSLYYTLSYPAGTQTSWGKNLYPLLPVVIPGMVIGWRPVSPGNGVMIVAAVIALLGAGCVWALAQLSLM